ncbi:MAG: cupin domain-containing protein [Clostridia bacterium]|nr:cupin domain-containing protein [Clostridia bacterium]
MSDFKHSSVDQLPVRHKCEHEGYEYIRKTFVHRNEARQCVVNVYEIPPMKSAFPYHYHHCNEEVFYIISGHGILRTPDSERAVSAGDLLFFPANERGAHKLTNSSASDDLVYIDFDTANDIDVTIYPDSGKIGVWGKDVNQIHKVKNQVDYYDGE